MTTVDRHPSYARYGRDFADIYDFIFPRAAVGDGELAWISRHLSSASKVLELGVGTGRVAIPLAEYLAQRRTGIVYRGVDISSEMLDRMRDADPDGRIEGVVADIVSTEYGTGYDAVLCVCATISMLTCATDQQTVFRKAADALKPGGTLVVETHNSELVEALHGNGPLTYAVPYPGFQRALVSFSTLEGTAWHVDHCWIDNGTARFASEDSRVTTSAELDAYASNAGLVLVERGAGLLGGAIEQSSATVTSVYRKPGR